MITLLPDLPPHVVGISASGQVTADDYETVLIPAIESARKEHGRVRILYQLGPDFTGFTPGAMWDDTKVGLAHPRSWDKIAIVSDVHWVNNAIRIFGFAVPWPMKVFPNAEFDEAMRWTVED